MPASYRFKVHGRVQGVFFRQSAAATARSLGLHGWVMNCADGSVEGCAAGGEHALEQLRQWLQHGPPAARVDRLEWLATAETIAAGFHLRR